MVMLTMIRVRVAHQTVESVVQRKASSGRQKDNNTTTLMSEKKGASDGAG